jgi:imidazolonepropionase-like amidohydrolase
VTQLVLRGCHVVTMDAGRAEHTGGYVVVDGNQIAAVGSGPVPDAYQGARVVDASG